MIVIRDLFSASVGVGVEVKVGVGVKVVVGVGMTVGVDVGVGVAVKVAVGVGVSSGWPCTMISGLPLISVVIGLWDGNNGEHPGPSRHSMVSMWTWLGRKVMGTRYSPLPK